MKYDSFIGVPCSKVPLPESFIEWNEVDYDEITAQSENDVWIVANTVTITTVSGLFEYFIGIMPRTIWRDFSLYLAQVVDYLLEHDDDNQLVVRLPQL